MDAGRLALAISQFYSRTPMSDVKVRVSPWKRSVGRMAQAKESRTADKRHQWSQKEERKPETAWFEIDFDRKDEDVVAVFDLFLLGLCDCLIHSHSVIEWATCYFSWKIGDFSGGLQKIRFFPRNWFRGKQKLLTIHADLISRKMSKSAKFNPREN